MSIIFILSHSPKHMIILQRISASLAEYSFVTFGVFGGHEENEGVGIGVGVGVGVGMRSVKC